MFDMCNLQNRTEQWGRREEGRDQRKLGAEAEEEV